MTYEKNIHLSIYLSIYLSIWISPPHLSISSSIYPTDRLSITLSTALTFLFSGFFLLAFSSSYFSSLFLSSLLISSISSLFIHSLTNIFHNHSLHSYPHTLKGWFQTQNRIPSPFRASRQVRTCPPVYQV